MLWCLPPTSFTLPMDVTTVSVGLSTWGASFAVPQHEGNEWLTALDHRVPTHRNEKAILASDVGLYTLLGASVVSGGAVAASCWNSGTAWRPALETVSVFAFTQGLTSLTKHLVGRPRPYTRGDGFSGDSDDFQSFFSGHASLSAASGSWMGGLWARSLTQDHRLWVVAQLAGGLAGGLGVGALRVEGAKHYWSDVLVGTGVGMIGGFLPMISDYRWQLDLKGILAPNGIELRGSW